LNCAAKDAEKLQLISVQVIAWCHQAITWINIDQEHCIAKDIDLKKQVPGLLVSCTSVLFPDELFVRQLDRVTVYLLKFFWKSCYKSLQQILFLSAELLSAYLMILQYIQQLKKVKNHSCIKEIASLIMETAGSFIMLPSDVSVGYRCVVQRK